MSQRPTSLMRRLMTWLLPVVMLPYVGLGGFVLYGVFATLESEALRSQRTAVALAVGYLEAEVDRADATLRAARLDFEGLPDARIPAALRALTQKNAAVASAYVLDEGFRILGSYPAAPEVIGSELVPISIETFVDDLAVSRLDDNDQSLYFYAGLRLSGGRRYLVVEVAPTRWAALVREQLGRDSDTFVALYPANRQAQVAQLSTQRHVPAEYEQLLALRNGAKTVEIDGYPYFAESMRIKRLQVELVAGRRVDSVTALSRRALVALGAVAIIIVTALLIVIWKHGRRVSNSMRGVIDATTALGEGRFDSRVSQAVSGPGEFGDLERTFNHMAETLQTQQVKIRALNRTMAEIFACKDGDGLFKKAVEIACTQCHGDLAYFVPTATGHEVEFADATIFVGLHGWIWRKHRVVPLDAETWPVASERHPGGKEFEFTLKHVGREIGLLKVSYLTLPSEEVVSLLHEVIGLIEASVVKLEQVRQSAMVSTELEVADAVRRAVAENAVPEAVRSRVAFHYEPSSRLGGDWFRVFAGASSDMMYVVIGDVSGNGLVQGMVTTAVKGALDTIASMVSAKPGIVDFGPAAIVQLLETVVSRVAGSRELQMSCLVVEVDFTRHSLRTCNAGHTFPLLIRDLGPANDVTHLFKDQQPSLGQSGAASHRYTDTVYELAPSDILVIYSDGLSQAKALKSQIFGRLLFRNLREKRAAQGPKELRDEILHMFQYYTQGRRTDDDVCFLVLQVGDQERDRVSA